MVEYQYTKPASLDSKDRKILELLNANARMSLTDIAKKTGIPIDTVRYRIRRMEKEGIFRYAIILDFGKMGYPIFNEVHFQFVSFTTEMEAKVKRYVKMRPHIIYSAKLAGKYDYVIAILARDLQQFDRILNDFKTEFQGIIKDFDVTLIIEEYKLDYVLDLISDKGKTEQ